MELSDGKWLSDLAFMVDITMHLSELNIKLQGPNQLVSSLISNVKSFEVKLSTTGEEKHCALSHSARTKA